MKKRKKVLNRKKILFGSIMLIFSIAVLSFIYSNDEKPIPHQNIVDLKISQYSDQNITSNAIVANPEFKHIVFEESEKTKNSFFSNQIAAVVKSVKSLVNPLIRTKESSREYGSWIWTPVPKMSSEYVETILTNAEKNGINTMYISIDSYLDIFTMEKGPEREKQKRLYSTKIEDFIVRANYKGIEVDAEAGWRNWAEEDNIYKAFAVINYVKDFNATHQNKFRGFQYDVEPYLLERYPREKASVLRNFIKLVDQTEYFLKKSDLKFSIVIPDFYDEEDKFTPVFSYNGKIESAFKHLINILDRRKDSSIILMSYRNYAEGDDGTIEISNNEMQTADKGNHNTQIIIAQETGDVPPPYITFHNTSKKYFNNEIREINNAFNNHPNFGGIAVHYVNAFLALK